MAGEPSSKVDPKVVSFTGKISDPDHVGARNWDLAPLKGEESRTITIHPDSRGMAELARRPEIAKTIIDAGLGQEFMFACGFCEFDTPAEAEKYRERIEVARALINQRPELVAIREIMEEINAAETGFVKAYAKRVNKPTSEEAREAFTTARTALQDCYAKNLQWSDFHISEEIRCYSDEIYNAMRASGGDKYR